MAQLTMNRYMQRRWFSGVSFVDEERDGVGELEFTTDAIAWIVARLTLWAPKPMPRIRWTKKPRPVQI